MKKQTVTLHIRRLALLLLCLVLAAGCLLPASAFAERAERKVVRVGWHEPPFFITDQYGRRSGYSYEYLRKLTAYTGWDYEYVEGSFSDLLQMLKDGKIDLMSNISYTEERAESILYASLPMGSEAYYIFTSPGNPDISPDDYGTLNGKRVGVAKGSFQKDLFLEWEKQHGVKAELVELSTTEEESLLLLGTDLDAFVTVDVYGSPDITEPVCKIGSSDFYFALSKDRPDLLVELNAAMNRIQDENIYYSENLHDKYLRSTETSEYLSSKEQDWLSGHGAIRVGYQDNYLAFCAQDRETGELTGALRDYLDYASDCMENAYLNFEPVCYPTVSAAIEAMKNGEVDCVFPANLTDYDAEQLGVVMTPALMRTEMDAVVRAAEQKEFVRKDPVIAAVNEGNTNYDLWVADHYPTWQRVYFPDTSAGLEAVAAGEADCVIISNYRFSNISKLCEKLHLAAVYTGVDMDYYFAVCEGDIELYSILSRVTNAVPDATVHKALTYYSTEDVKTSFRDIVRDNLFLVMTGIAVILLVILILLVRNIHAEKKVLEEEHLVEDLNKRVFVDALTHVRNKGGFDNYLQELQDRLDQGEEIPFAVGVFDCDNLKTVNDRSGHDKGNLYLQAASRLICHVFKHSPVFRVGGDEFVVILRDDDFENREELVREFEKEREEICASAENKWDEVHVSLGVAVYDPEIDSSANDTVRRADKIMYENKRSGRNVL